MQVIKNYSINYRDADRNTPWRAESSLRHNVVLLKLLPYTVYAVKVTAHTDLGPGQTSSEITARTKSGSKLFQGYFKRKALEFISFEGELI